ncbi:Transcription factor vib-1 [Smittium mucronatum]|uniref:Transcription factor vib-1 n=1 Tax=Smittium mucronatum TaxID=133383 RepID=A0A1R0H1L7_9FUNG|nr:Transcription factor vib-1 [Smittium mucronatum]
MDSHPYSNDNAYFSNSYKFDKKDYNSAQKSPRFNYDQPGPSSHNDYLLQKQSFNQPFNSNLNVNDNSQNTNVSLKTEINTSSNYYLENIQSYNQNSTQSLNNEKQRPLDRPQDSETSKLPFSSDPASHEPSKAQSNHPQFINFTNSSKDSDLHPDIFEYSPVGSNMPLRRKTFDQFVFSKSDPKIPFFCDTSTSKYMLVNSIYPNNVATPKLKCKVDRGFFLSSGEWTCYRRNYFQISSSFELCYEPSSVDGFNSDIISSDASFNPDTSKDKGDRFNSSAPSSGRDDPDSLAPPINSQGETTPQKSNTDNRNQLSTSPSFLVLDSQSKKSFPVSSFSLGISAQAVLDDSGNSSPSIPYKRIDLIQHTPKRDKGPQITPPNLEIVPVEKPSFNRPHPQQRTSNSQMINNNYVPGANPFSSSSQSNYTVCFERLQFKTATANNGKRRAAQQYYKLILTLYAELKSGKRLSIACISSAPLVVRGRSPSHYSDNSSSANSAGHGGQSIRFHNSGLSQISEKSISSQSMDSFSHMSSQSGFLLPSINKSFGDRNSNSGSSATLTVPNFQIPLPPPPLSASSSSSALYQPPNSANINSNIFPINNNTDPSFSQGNNVIENDGGDIRLNNNFNNFVLPPLPNPPGKYDSVYQINQPNIPRLNNSNYESNSNETKIDNNDLYSPTRESIDLPKISSFAIPSGVGSRQNKNDSLNLGFNHQNLSIQIPDKLSMDPKSGLNSGADFIPSAYTADFSQANDQDYTSQIPQPANGRQQAAGFIGKDYRINRVYSQSNFISNQSSDFDIQKNHYSSNNIDPESIEKFSGMMSSAPVPLVGNRGELSLANEDVNMNQNGPISAQSRGFDPSKPQMLGPYNYSRMGDQDFGRQPNSGFNVNEGIGERLSSGFDRVESSDFPGGGRNFDYRQRINSETDFNMRERFMDVQRTAGGSFFSGGEANKGQRDAFPDQQKRRYLGYDQNSTYGQRPDVMQEPYNQRKMSDNYASNNQYFDERMMAEQQTRYQFYPTGPPSKALNESNVNNIRSDEFSDNFGIDSQISPYYSRFDGGRKDVNGFNLQSYEGAQQGGNMNVISVTSNEGMPQNELNSGGGFTSSVPGKAGAAMQKQDKAQPNMMQGSLDYQIFVSSADSNNQY